MKRKVGRPSSRAATRGSKARSPARTRPQKAPTPPRTVLQYKVIELSTVDEASLEEVVNTYSREGWAFEGVQFAMRDASRRPSMAFVFMTRKVPAQPRPREQSGHTLSQEDQARERLVRLATPIEHPKSDALPEPYDARRSTSAYERLRQLAEMSADDDGDAEDDR